VKIDPRFILVLGVALASPLLAGADDDEKASGSVLVTLTKVVKGSMDETVSGFGTVQAQPSAKQTVTSPLTATVSNIYVQLGAEVAKGAPLVRLVPNPQTSASYIQANSTLRVAQDQLARTRQLLADHLATRQDLANAEKSEQDAEAALTALKAQGAGGPTTLRAPYQAIVTNIPANTGTIVMEGAPLLDLAPPNSLVLRVGVIPEDAGAIKSGNKVKVIPVGSAKSYDASVLLRGSVVDPQTGLVPVDVSLPSGALLPGQTAQAEITTGTMSGYIVPHEAVLVDDKGQAYIVQEIRMAAKLVHIRLVKSGGAKDVVAGALDPNAPIVLAGNYQLQDGMKVRLTDPAGDEGK
jgi:membrane fusion protein, multidrug efflux system